MEKKLRLSLAGLAVLTLAGCGDNAGSSLMQGGSSASRAQETPYVAPVDAERLAVGVDFTLALALDGSVYAWGNNEYGQLGDGTVNGSTIPTPVRGLSNVRSISAGGFHGVATLQNGTMWAWGSNHFKQISNDPAAGYTVPRPLTGLSGVRLVSARNFHNVALTRDGGVYAWGFMGGTTRTAPTPIAGLSPARAVAAGGAFALAVKSDGTVWGWGSNSYNELAQTQKISSSVNAIQVPGIDNVIAVAAGTSHALALRADGSVWAWGQNTFSQAGPGDGTRPTQIELPLVDHVSKKVVAMAASSYNSAVLYSDGSVYAWGRNAYGQLGSDQGPVVSTPVRLSLPGVAVSLAVASDTIMVLNKDGSVFGVGYNNEGQIGNHTRRNTAVPVQTAGTNGYGFINLGKSAGN